MHSISSLASSRELLDMKSVAFVLQRGLVIASQSCRSFLLSGLMVSIALVCPYGVITIVLLMIVSINDRK